MAATSPWTPGANNGGADKLAVFLKLFSGDVIRIFKQEATVRQFIRFTDIEGGKSKQWPAIGRATASYFQRGDDMIRDGSYLNDISVGERVIHLDRTLVAPTFIDKLDEKMAQYDTVSESARELAVALSEHEDQILLRLACVTARATTGPTADSDIGKVLYQSTMETVATLIKGIRVAAQLLDDNKVPQSERVLYVRPQEYRALVEDGTIINKDIGGEGSIAQGTIFFALGFRLVMTTHVPSTNYVVTGNQHAGTSAQNSYTGDFSNTVAIAMHKSAIGGICAFQPSVRMEDKIELDGTFIVAKQACGYGALYEGAVVELSKSAAGAEMDNTAALTGYSN